MSVAETLDFKITEDYIELNSLLKAVHLVGSGGEAKVAILEGLVQVNGETESRIRRKLRVGDRVEFAGKIIKIL